jgi:hypothetical protein
VPDVVAVMPELPPPIFPPDPLCVVDPAIVVVEAAPPDPEAVLGGSEVSEQAGAMTSTKSRTVDFIDDRGR